MQTKQLADHSNQNSDDDLPDFKKVQHTAAIKRVIILLILSALVILLGFVFKVDLTAWVKLLRLLR